MRNRHAATQDEDRIESRVPALDRAAHRGCCPPQVAELVDREGGWAVVVSPAPGEALLEEVFHRKAAVEKGSLPP